MCNEIIWRSLKVDDRYEVSNTGIVRKKGTTLQYLGNTIEVPGSILQPYINNGFLFVNFKGRSFAIHKLVAQAFVDNSEDLRVVHHVDGNKLNNHADNLVWISSTSQMRLIKRSPNYKESRRNSHPIQCVQTGQVYPSVRSAWTELNVKDPTLTYEALRQSILSNEPILGLTFVRL